MAMIPIGEYAARHGKSHQSAFIRVKQGRYASARKVGAFWYIDEDEPWKGIGKSLVESNCKMPENQLSEYGIGGKIPLKEYCKLYDLNRLSVTYKCKNGELKSAEMIGGQWFVDANETIIGKREKKLMSGKPGMIGIKEYCTRYRVKRGTVVSRCQHGRFKSAEKIGGVWFIDENESFTDRRIKEGKFRNDIKKQLKEQKDKMETLGKIRFTEYCKRNQKSYISASRKCKNGDFKSAVKIGGVWFIDENEPYIDRRANNGRRFKSESLEQFKINNDEKEMHGMISLKEYCRRNGKNCVSASRKCKNGDFKSALKISGWWYIDENEPYNDMRVKSGKQNKNRSS